MIRYFVSNSGRYIGTLEPDEMARDPRTDKYLAPELVPDMVQQYEDGDVWLSMIYEYTPRLKPGAIYRDADELIGASLLGEEIDTCGEQYGYDYARDMLLMQLEHLDRLGERRIANDD